MRSEQNAAQRQRHNIDNSQQQPFNRSIKQSNQQLDQRATR